MLLAGPKVTIHPPAEVVISGFWTFFDAYKVPILRGRDFAQQDDGSAPGSCVIDEAMAKQYWPKGDPLQDRLIIGADVLDQLSSKDPDNIGVVGDMHTDGLDQDPFPRCPFRWRKCRTK